MARKSSAAVGGPTINDLALHLGVHKSTVSRAMDPARQHLIGASVQQRVQAAALELGWRPNRAAAALATGKSRTVGVLLPDITNPVFPPILRGIEDALDAEGYFALLANTARREGGVAAAQAAVERMGAMRVEGFIVATALRDDTWLDGLRNSGARIVLVNRTNEVRADASNSASEGASDGARNNAKNNRRPSRGPLPSVTSDDRLGMRLAVDHLAALGHRRLAHLAGPAGFSTGLARRVGFEQALQAHGLTPAALAECAAYSIEAGAAGMAQLLAAGSAFTAVVAANDLIALGALQVLHGRGISVPQAMSVIGHNDMPLLDQISPPLTSVRIQHYAMGLQAARLLLDALRGVPAGASTVVLRPELVLRGSTAPPPPVRRR